VRFILVVALLAISLLFGCGAQSSAPPENGQLQTSTPAITQTINAQNITIHNAEYGYEVTYDPNYFTAVSDEEVKSMQSNKKMFVVGVLFPVAFGKNKVITFMIYYDENSSVCPSSQKGAEDTMNKMKDSLSVHNRKIQNSQYKEATIDGKNGYEISYDDVMYDSKTNTTTTFNSKGIFIAVNGKGCYILNSVSDKELDENWKKELINVVNSFKFIDT